MSLQGWLKSAQADADARGLPALKPLLEGLAQSTTFLRGADFEASARPRRAPAGAAAMPQTPGVRLDLPGSAERVREARDAERPPTIDEFGRRLRAGATSSVEATEACLKAIAARDGELNAFILVTADEARRQARDADAELAAGLDRGPLHGVPLSLKDLFDVRGTATTAGSNVRRHDVAPHDAPVVTALRQAGAVFVGKTNLHEFAFGTTNEDSGFGPARHPSDPLRSPGGSSGGSAASVAAGMALGTLGTDTGGSIRIPSAMCGLVGLKPTSGEVPVDGVVPLSRTLDHVGPLASSVTDAWYLYDAVAGRPQAGGSGPRPLVAAPLAGLRLAVPTRYFCDLLDGEVRAAFGAALARLAGAGARIVPVDIAHADYIAAIYLQIVFAEAAAYHATTLAATPDLYTVPVRMRLELARYVLAEDYLRAMTGREVLRREVDAALSWHDVLVLPTVPVTATTIGEPDVRIGGTTHPVRNVTLRLTQLFNITGHPAVTLPCGVSSAGLPIGLQLAGRRHETHALMRVALGVEQALRA